MVFINYKILLLMALLISNYFVMMKIPITQARKSLFFMPNFGSETPFMLLAKLKVKGDKVAEYLEIADKTDKAVEADEPGMLHHTFDQDPYDPLRFLVRSL